MPLYRIISSIVNLKHNETDLSTYIGWMSSLKDEFLSIMPKSTNIETSQSKTNRAFMILTLIGLLSDLDTIQEQIFIGPFVPTFDEVFTRLLRHSSTTTQSLPPENTQDTSMVVSQPSSRSDSQSGRRSNRGITHTATSLAIPVIVATSYIADLHALLIWLNLLILLILRLRVRASPEEAHTHLRESFLRPTSMRITSASLKQQNLHLLHLLPRLVMPLMSSTFFLT